VDRNPSKCIVNYTLNGNAVALPVNKSAYSSAFNIIMSIIAFNVQKNEFFYAHFKNVYTLYIRH
jgi:hypothetical protein